MPKKTDLTTEGYPVYSGYRLVGHSSSYHYREPEIIVVARGVGGTGDIKMTPPFCFLTNLSIAILPESPEVFKRFLFYQLSATTLWELRTGSAQAQITIERLKDFAIEIPPLPVQRRIAGILSAYDDLIENNQRRIRILEAMARALYREWFVHFRFPGHEKVPRVASSLGAIPQGWEVKQLGDIAEDMRRNVPKGELDEPKRYVGLEHIPRRSLALDAWEMATDLGSNKLEFKKREVLFGKIRPYFHKVSVAPFDGLCSADTIVIRSRRPEHYAYVVACVSSDAFVAEASATANGAKMPRANWDVLENYQVVIPNGKVAERFSVLFSDIIAQQQALIFQIQNLRRTRNLLLPRLLSGEAIPALLADVHAARQGA
jgi:type I restriction enzyme S subunit